jgi:hypothetical protein
LACLVAVSGFAAGAPGTQDFVPRVALAVAPERTGVIGVVRSRMALVPKAGKEGADALALESVPGDAAPGDFVALTVRGVTLVRAELSEAIEVGQRLALADSDGRVRPSRSRVLEGMEVTEGTSVVGVAVGVVDEESELVPVYVMLP